MAQRCRERDELGQRHQRRPERDHAPGIGDVDRLRVAGEEEQRGIVDDDRQAERDEQDVLVLAVAEMADEGAIEQVSEGKGARGDDGQRDIGVEPQRLSPEEKHRVHRQHEQAAVREVDDVQDAVDQREPDGDEHVDAAGHQAVDQPGEKDLRAQHAIVGRTAVPSGAEALQSKAASADPAREAQLNFGFGNTADADAN